MREEILHRGDQRDCLRLLLVSRVVSIVPSLSISISISISLLVLFCGVINSEQPTTVFASARCAARERLTVLLSESTEFGLQLVGSPARQLAGRSGLAQPHERPPNV